MTKFIDRTKDKNIKPNKNTVFTMIVRLYKVEKIPDVLASDWKYVEFIGRDRTYGDVFKVWNTNEGDFVIYFGEKGDEQYD